jgi:hypothetical protein
MRDDQDIMRRIMARLFTELEPVNVPLRWDPVRPWEWNLADPPWPRLIAAVKQHSPRTATLEILAWALGKRVSYLKRLIERTPRRPLGL